MLGWPWSLCFSAVLRTVIISSHAILPSQRHPLKLSKSQTGPVNFFLLHAHDETRGEQNVLFWRRLCNRRPSVTLLQGSPQKSLVWPPYALFTDGARCWTEVISEVTYSEYLNIIEYERKNKTALFLREDTKQSFPLESFPELFQIVLQDSKTKNKKVVGLNAGEWDAQRVPFVYPDATHVNGSVLESCLRIQIFLRLWSGYTFTNPQ